MKNNTLTTAQAIFSAVGAFISAKLGIAYPAFLLLLFFMILDYVTGMLAAKKSGSWSSKVGLWGIVKKTTYILIIMVAVGIDYVIIAYTQYLGFSIPLASFFSVLVTLWFLFNEAISIMENCIKLEAVLPSFFKGFLETAKKLIDTTGEEFNQNIDKR